MQEGQRVGGQIGENFESEGDVVLRRVAHNGIGYYVALRVGRSAEGEAVHLHAAQGEALGNAVTRQRGYGVGTKQHCRLVAEKTFGATQGSGLVGRLKRIEKVEVEPSVVTAIVAPIEVVVAFLVHAVDIEGMTAKRHVVTCVANGTALFQFVAKQLVPGSVGVKRALDELNSLISKHTVQGFHGAIDAGSTARDAPAHVGCHAQPIGEIGYGIRLGIAESIAIVGQNIVPVDDLTRQYILNGVVICLPTKQRVERGGRILPVGDYLFQTSGNATRDAARGAYRAVFINIIRTSPVEGIVLSADTAQQRVHGGATQTVGIASPRTVLLQHLLQELRHVLRSLIGIKMKSVGECLPLARDAMLGKARLGKEPAAQRCYEQEYPSECSQFSTSFQCSTAPLRRAGSAPLKSML